MISLLFFFVVVQAALLLWASIQLSNVFLGETQLAPAAWAVLTVAGALIISVYGGKIDLQRALCRPGDCAILLLSVACVRVISVNMENERLNLERKLAAQAAAEAAEAEARAHETQRLAEAAAALEARSFTRPERALPAARPGSSPIPRSAARLIQPPARPGS